MGTPVVIPSIAAASSAANDWYESVTGQRNPSSSALVASAQAKEISGQLAGSGVLSSISSAVSRASGSPVAASTSAAGQYDLDSLISRVEALAGSNTALSAQQAEDLRRWQEIQNAKAMEFNAAEASKNRDWQKMMSDTAHQREVADLQAAGLNPVLSAMGGQGAYVGSGATASGVTSSGAQGQVDQSSSTGLVQLLGSLLASQTSLANAALSAQTQSSIADKTNAVNQLIASITGQYGLARERLSGEYGLSRQWMSDSSAYWRTAQTSAATKYAADRSYAASKYSADSHLTGTKYSADRSYAASKYSADSHLTGTKYSADQALEAAVYAADSAYARERDFPSNGWQAFFSVLGQLLGTSDRGSGSSGPISTLFDLLFGKKTGFPERSGSMSRGGGFSGSR